MSGIVITPSMRSNLLSLQNTTALMDQTQGRLSTGYKVNSALDNPSSYFSASSLRNRSQDLAGRLDGMGQGIQLLKSADEGIKGLQKLVSQLKGLTDQAKATTNTTERASLAGEYDNIRTQINQLVKDAGYKGVNLLSGDSMDVVFNEDSSSKLSITGVTYDAAGLGLTAATSSWATNANIDTDIALVDAAVKTLRAQAKTFGSNLAVVTLRQDFTKAMVNTLNEGADKLTLADMNEEGANMVALQTRQQLGIQALSMANQAQQGIMRLFG